VGWPLSILVGVLDAVAACGGALALGTLCARWYRVSSFEGAAGYFVVSFGLVGSLVGFAIGVGSARYLTSGPAPTFLHALGLALAITVALLALGVGIAWLAADLPPRIDGHDLALEVEVRLPPGAPLPPDEVGRPHGWHVTITGDYGDRRQSSDALRRAEAVRSDGRWVIPARVVLLTGGRYSIGIKVADAETQYFRPAWSRPPALADMQWGAWQQRPHAGNLVPVPDAEGLEIRTRVQFLPDEP
jgi:hypothetical protein